MNTQHTFRITPLSLMTILATCIALSACGGGGSSDGGNTGNGNNTSNTGNTGNSGSGSSTSALQTNAAVAKNFVDNLAIPAYQRIATQSTGLSGSIQSYCDAIGKSNEAAALASAKSAWLALKNNWQGTQIYAVGPVAANNGNLAKRIYTANRFDSATQTFIATEVAKRKADKSYQLAATVVNSARGLDALEYLLYTPENDATKKTDNCNYAVVVAKDVKVGADAIVSAWTDKNTGRNAFLTNKASNGVDLIQPFFDNVVTVIDKNLKDADLATPLALKSQGVCGKDACPELVENKLSKSTYANMKANLVTLNDLYSGKGGDGFALYYKNNNMDSQGVAFQKLIANATTAVTQSKSLFDQATAINAGNKGAACKTVSSSGQTQDADLKACAAFYHIKQLSDAVKTGSFKAAVNLNLPSAAAGDGD